MSWNLFFENRNIKLLDNNNNDKTINLNYYISNPENNYGKKYIINYDDFLFDKEKIINDFGNVYNDNLTYNGYDAYCFNNIDELIINDAIFVFLSNTNHFKFENIRHLIIKDKYNNNNLLIDITNIKSLHINFGIIQSINLNDVHINKLNINNELDFLKIYIFDPKNINELKMKSNKYYINNGYNKLSYKSNGLSYMKSYETYLLLKEDIDKDSEDNIKKHIKLININDKEY